MREPLSRERVLGAAVALADKEGMGALTMRRLAADLGVEAMSLYYHLPGKKALLDGLVETVLGEVIAAVDESAERASQRGTSEERSAAERAELAERAANSAERASQRGTSEERSAAERAELAERAANSAARRTKRTSDWRGRLRRWFLAARAVMLRHPWAPALMSSRRQVPPGLYEYYERILATLTEAGFSYRIAHRALHAFGSMPLGFVQELFSPEAGEAGDAAVSEQGLAAMAEIMPHMAAMVSAELHDPADPTLGWCDSQVEFEFTLDLLLDGLERFRNA